jgi:uncharacterized membrane protein
VTRYELLKFLHVLLAIVAVGFNASYGVWLARARREPGQLAYVLRGIKVLDDRFANPAYAVLLVTGLLMVWDGDLDLGTLWISASIALYVGVVVVGLLGYSPALRRQLAASETGDVTSVAAANRRATIFGLLTTAMVLLIVFLMVTKPD